jgi:hypothetical protein
MGGGLMQLVAYGAQDVFLTGNPQISFFKVVYRRHTNFAMESIEQTFNGNPELGNRVTCTISRNGDLITNMWLEVDFEDNFSSSQPVNSLGHSLIEYITLEIGGQQIDKHYGEWLEIWSELTMPEEKRNGFKEMIGRRDAGVTYSPESKKLYIPLQFFFCRNPGLALPLIALQYHEVKVNIKFRSAGELSRGTENVKFNTNPRLYVDYIYLDTEERRRFAQSQHEYLIEQLQHTGPESTKDDNHRLNFNHPVKEIIWVTRKSNADPMEFGNVDHAAGNYFAEDSLYAEDSISMPTTYDSFTKCKLQLNGHDRFSERDASYFRLVQPYQHHTRVPSKFIYLYSFAINPESHQPSGTCNFSRLDNVTLTLTDLKNKSADGELLVYAVSNNILRIMSGMGGLAYSN